MIYKSIWISNHVQLFFNFGTFPNKFWTIYKKSLINTSIRQKITSFVFTVLKIYIISILITILTHIHHFLWSDIRDEIILYFPWQTLNRFTCCISHLCRTTMFNVITAYCWIFNETYFFRTLRDQNSVIGIFWTFHYLLLCHFLKLWTCRKFWLFFWRRLYRFWICHQFLDI